MVKRSFPSLLFRNIVQELIETEEKYVQALEHVVNVRSA